MGSIAANRLFTPDPSAWRQAENLINPVGPRQCIIIGNVAVPLTNVLMFKEIVEILGWRRMAKDVPQGEAPRRLLEKEVMQI